MRINEIQGKNGGDEVTLDKTLISDARACIDKMIELGAL